MPLRLKLALIASVLGHAAFLFFFAGLSTWRMQKIATLSPAGGVVWLNLETGGEGTGGAGGLGAPEKGVESTAPSSPEKEKETKEESTPKKKAQVIREKSQTKTVPVLVPPREKTASLPEAQGPAQREAWPGPGQGDIRGAQTGPGQGEGTGSGTGKGGGTGTGEGPGGIGSPGSGGEGSGGEGDRTLGIIRAKILKAKRYPREARQEGIEGICGVMFAINPDGSLKLLQLMESSGFEVLDQEALATVRRAAPFPYYASPIRFKLRFSLKDR